MAGQLRSRYDVIINGGGVVGFTLLNLILKSPHLSGCKVLLIEQTVKPSEFTQKVRTIGQEKSFSNRVSSISYASKLAFKRLGIWDTLRPYVKDIHKIKVWNYEYKHKLVFGQDLPSCQQDKEELDVMFSILENNRLSNALLNSIHQIGAENNISWSSKLVNMAESLDAGRIDITIDNGKGENLETSGSIVLGCDGFKSKVRELTSIKYMEYDSKKSAVVGTVKMSPNLINQDNNVAYQKFSAEKDTVAALLPLDDEFSSFVISAPRDYAKHLTECDEKSFQEEFNLLLTSNEAAKNPIMRAAHQFVNATSDNLLSLVQLIGPSCSLSSSVSDLEFELDDVPPRIERVLENSRAMFPLIFGSTSPKMVTSLPGLNRSQIALLGDASHRLHPLAGQGLNLGIQDALEIVNQLEAFGKVGENVFSDPSIICKALARYEIKRQAYVIPMSAAILAMQDLFKLTPSRVISGLNRCQPMKTISVKIANGI